MECDAICIRNMVNDSSTQKEIRNHSASTVLASEQCDIAVHCKMAKIAYE